MQKIKNNSYRFRKFDQNKKTWSKRLLLVIPFLLLSLFLVVIPMLMIIIQSFTPVENSSINDNWNFINDFIWIKILKSMGIALATTLICIFIAYPFSYFLAFNKSKIFKSLVIMVVTAPIWVSFLVKLVGLKTFFDAMYGYANATYGDVFTIIGLVYLYIPFMILPLYSVLNDMPKSLIYASRDLGYNNFKTFLNIVVPYSKTALASGITLVFLPAMTTVAVPQFLNNAADGSLIADIIVQEGELALTSPIALARASSLSLLLAIIIVIIYVLFIAIKKYVLNWKRKHLTNYAK